MLIPYRVKNPITRFPFATVAILAANMGVFALTSEYFLVIRHPVLVAYSFTWGVSPPWTFFTAAFLHADIFHLAGNMLFLWVFGRAVEDRLGVGRFLAVYLVAGMAGDVLQALLGSAAADPVPTLGASGCIMGLLGAYWYLFSWSPVCVFYFFWILFFIRVGTFEIAAFWVIGAYVMLDVLSGAWNSATGVVGGVANFAHVGGAAAGALVCFALGMKRDTGAVSKAKATYADVKDLGDVPLLQLVTMLEQDPANPSIVRAMLGPAIAAGERDLVDRVMARAGSVLMEKDPDLVATYVADLGGDPSLYPIGQLMWLADNQQHSGDPDMALKLYQRITERFPDTPDMETALCRMAQIHWNVRRDGQSARQCVDAMLAKSPFGPMASVGEALLRDIEQAA
jgi:membrane associated rhomboid family serine protease